MAERTTVLILRAANQDCNRHFFRKHSFCLLSEMYFAKSTILQWMQIKCFGIHQNTSVWLADSSFYSFSCCSHSSSKWNNKRYMRSYYTLIKVLAAILYYTVVLYIMMWNCETRSCLIVIATLIKILNDVDAKFEAFTFCKV